MTQKKRTWLMILLATGAFAAVFPASAMAASGCCAGRAMAAPKAHASDTEHATLDLDVRATEQALEGYLAIQKSLAADSMKNVTANATALHAITKLPEAEKLASASDIETARLHFERLSGPLIAAARKHGVEKNGLRLAHCPMAFNNRGASWLQEGEPLANPYYGARMLRCGEFRDL